jgi:hypothetical protein
MPCQTVTDIGEELSQGKEAFDRLETAYHEKVKDSRYRRERGLIERELSEALIALKRHKQICRICGTAFKAA